MMRIRGILLSKSFLKRSQQASRTALSTDVKDVPVLVDKELLMKLRRKTGYGFANCKKALVQFGEDLAAAEKWLHENAQKEGWASAGKMENRKAGQGLLGVYSDGRRGVVVEVNCETDFVARNMKFQSLVAAATHCAFANIQESATDIIPLDLADVPIPSVPGLAHHGSLGELLTLTISQVKEKLQISRGACLGNPSPNGAVIGYVHPRTIGTHQSGVLMGEFGTLVSLTRIGPHDVFPIEKVGEFIGRHIVGLNPERVGSLEGETSSSSSSEGSSSSEEEGKDKRKELLHQAFLLRPDHSVAHYLKDHEMRVEGFIRMERGRQHQEQQE